VPISGRPPSLINRPTGCSFHPRCPYQRPAHRQVEPTLEPTAGVPAHEVACLLGEQTRRKLWRELRGGALPADARAAVLDDEAQRP
jgi:peptide/nickel transport system ATP-binding protein